MTAAVIAGAWRCCARPGCSRSVALLEAALLMLASGAGIAAAPAPAAPSLRVSAPATVRASEARDIVVTIANDGAGPVVVLPNAVRLRIEGAGAHYVPYPGPALDPWGGARELAPGERMAVAFPDTSDGRGTWKLPPGDYRVAATYAVPQDLATPPALARPELVWRGRTEGAPATMTVVSAR